VLTLTELKEMNPSTIFAEGLVKDSPDGINLTGSQRELRWVATRGGIWDWAIYVHSAGYNAGWIQRHGDKLHNRAMIQKLVPCDDEALAMYRD
jgi:hypothetical protein